MDLSILFIRQSIFLPNFRLAGLSQHTSALYYADQQSAFKSALSLFNLDKVNLVLTVFWQMYTFV